MNISDVIDDSYEESILKSNRLEVEITDETLSSFTYEPDDESSKQENSQEFLSRHSPTKSIPLVLINGNQCNISKEEIIEVDDTLPFTYEQDNECSLQEDTKHFLSQHSSSKTEDQITPHAHSNISDITDEDSEYDHLIFNSKSNRRPRLITSDAEDEHESVDDSSSNNEKIVDGSNELDSFIKNTSNEHIEEFPNKLNDMKNKIQSTPRQPTINSLIQNITLKENNQNRVEKKYFCSPIEYSNQASKVANLRTDVLKCKNALRTVNLSSLPDKGALLQQRQKNLEKQLVVEEEMLNKMEINNERSEEKKITWDQLVANSNCVVPKTFGKQAMNTYSTQKSLTMDRLKNLHDSLATCPSENTVAEDPKGLKVELMNHQRRALAWLMWRESQKPAGGILADDMGLGKTLTMISLILQTKEHEYDTETDSENEEQENDKWRSKNKKYRPQGGTLVICPASLIGQWETEIQRRVKRNLFNTLCYHGTKRETSANRLSKYDIVITTYKLSQGEYERKGPLFSIKWKRIILDEAHVIRNYKSQTSIAVCGLMAKTRWALTGTPVHNKELDLYALLKFLRCSPFDDLTVWKQWVANKNAGGQDRLNTVMTSILLRRTKIQLQTDGYLKGLPEKIIEEISIELDDEEKQVYQKVLLFSRSLFIEFLRQKEAKNPDFIYMRGSTTVTDKNNDEQYNKMHRKILEMYGGANIKSHQILVLLLRLRQICCHPSLIHAILDDDNCANEGIEEDTIDMDIFDKFERLNLNEDESIHSESDKSNPNEPADFNTAASKILSSSNPVFNIDRPNAKLKIVQKIIEEKVIPNGDKIIIVSQWTSMLKIILEHLKRANIKCLILDGSIPVQKRNELIENFNDTTYKVKVLLLSLTAGGVGLNLVGANHLLLVDLHWNPQLESQAQDRIYRVGQKKTVYVYKIVTAETIEERIKSLQDRKLIMASDILAGTRAAGASKLSLDDLKLLFNVGAPQ